MKYDLYIKNGKIVSSRNTTEAGVLVKDGKIASFVYGDDTGIEALEVVDAAGKYILPGLIDIHVHFREPGLTYKEDFFTGSTAAACGGITTVLDMPNVQPITSTVEALKLKISEISSKAVVDYGLIGVVVADNLGELENLAAEGIVNYKIFMGSTVGNIPAPMDGGIIEALKIIAGTGLRCGFHAENNDILNYYTDVLKKQGRTDPKAHVEGRPNLAEAEAISRCILFAKATGCKIHIYHMSSKEGVGLVRQGKESGVDVTAETGPHYLLLDCSHMDKVGSMLKMNPPVRYPEDSSKLWEGLLDGTIEVIATDHSPHTLEEKLNDNIWDATPGFCGVETSVPLLLTQVNAGVISLNKYVERASEGPARKFNMYPQKGSLLPGTDADFTIVDMDKEKVLRAEDLHSKNKPTPYEGFKVKGVPVMTIIRGKVVMKDGKILGSPQGKMVKPSL